MRDQIGIDEAIEEFPEIFELKAFPGKLFKINRASSYVNDNGVIMLYTFVKIYEDDQYGNKAGDWVAFAKGSVEELEREMVQ